MSKLLNRKKKFTDNDKIGLVSSSKEEQCNLIRILIIIMLYFLGS